MSIDHAMLHSVARLLEECAALQAGNPLHQAACLRGAQVIARHALAAEGLDAIADRFLPEQHALAKLLGGLVLPTVPGAAGYVANRVLIDGVLSAWAARKDGVGDGQSPDHLFEAASQIDCQFTAAQAAASTNDAAAWRRGRHVAVDMIDDARLTAYLRGRFPEYPEIAAHDIRKLGGMNANEAYSGVISGHPDWPRDVIVRRMLPAKIQPRSITEEFDVLAAMQATGIPVPRPLFCESAGSDLGPAVIVVERLDGETRTLTDNPDEARRIFHTLAGMMARLHVIDVAVMPLTRRAGSQDALTWLVERITRWEDDWRCATDDPVPTVSNAFHWLRRHADRFCRLQAIVHGDLDQRNLLVRGDRIIALIDWEVAHQGHPAEDLAYVREQVEAVMPWADFTAAYEAAGGSRFDDFEMRYAAVLCNMLRVTTSMAAHKAYVAGSIDNFLMGTVRTIETEQACQALHSAIYHAEHQGSSQP